MVDVKQVLNDFFGVEAPIDADGFYNIVLLEKVDGYDVNIAHPNDWEVLDLSHACILTFNEQELTIHLTNNGATRALFADMNVDKIDMEEEEALEEGEVEMQQALHFYLDGFEDCHLVLRLKPIVSLEFVSDKVVVEEEEEAV
ncbi:hypothetical protein [Massilibacterium senegalense]|uniref:hypothetical protein n=1 Tax=Massilibacterium senegalense TaxID=1632858 RepID=UPI00078470BE|nr:hypothetical protein [Massilibacterium senegalense]